MSKQILITGASTGIGAETARVLADGNTVFVHYNSSKKPAEAVAAEVNAAGGTAIVVQADLSSEEGCRILVQAVSANTDKLDVLVNNAGGLIKRQGVGDFEWGLMEEIFSLNAFSTMMVTSLCVPLLKKGTDPSIVNLTSVAMRHGAPTATIYGASKAALDSFTRGIAKELAPTIRVNAVSPGVIVTPFHEKVSTPEQLEAWREGTPLQKNGNSNHIAEAIKFLVKNDFISGETIDINGGLFMR